jgi:hypothetical protein
VHFGDCFSDEGCVGLWRWLFRGKVGVLNVTEMEWREGSEIILLSERRGRLLNGPNQVGKEEKAMRVGPV